MPLDNMAPAGAAMDAGGTSGEKPQMVCPECGCKFEKVETDGEAGGGEDKSWEDELRGMTARTPETSQSE
jgi:hypothetical protein